MEINFAEFCGIENDLFLKLKIMQHSSTRCIEKYVIKKKKKKKTQEKIKIMKTTA